MPRLAPPLPPGETIHLPGRGNTFIRHAEGPPGAPTLFLLHGWTANADLNWFPLFGPLAERYRVLAIDHRGHGRGIRSRVRFRLSDCADDVAAVCDTLGLGPVIPVGYSMGGPIAQLLWHRHRDLVSGLVLCATSRNFRGTRGERMWFQALGGLSAMARLTPEQWRTAVAGRFLSRRIEASPLEEWARAELRRNDPRMLVEAGAALGRFSSHAWIGDVDVPTAVVVTERDRVVPPERQRKLAASIPAATVHTVDADHTGCVDATDRFLPALLAACASVTSRTPAADPAA